MLPASTALLRMPAAAAASGGAGALSPIFLLVFPLLGPDYPLDSAAAAVASALLTETFGWGILGPAPTPGSRGA